MIKTIRVVTVSLLVLAAGVSLLALTPVLTSDQYLFPNDSVSAEGCTLIYQNDGNLVLYCGGSATWSSGTYGTSPGFAVMASDGNLIVYDGNGSPVWQSVTNGHNGASVNILSGNNVSIRSPGGTELWRGGWPLNWFSDACVQHYEAGYAGYHDNRIDIMCNEWVQVVAHPASPYYCRNLPYFAAVANVVANSCGGSTGCYECNAGGCHETPFCGSPWY